MFVSGEQAHWLRSRTHGFLVQHPQVEQGLRTYIKTLSFSHESVTLISGWGKCQKDADNRNALFMDKHRPRWGSLIIRVLACASTQLKLLRLDEVVASQGESSWGDLRDMANRRSKAHFAGMVTLEDMPFAASCSVLLCLSIVRLLSRGRGMKVGAGSE